MKNLLAIFTNYSCTMQETKHFWAQVLSSSKKELRDQFKLGGIFNQLDK